MKIEHCEFLAILFLGLFVVTLIHWIQEIRAHYRTLKEWQNTINAWKYWINLRESGLKELEKDSDK